MDNQDNLVQGLLQVVNMLVDQVTLLQKDNEELKRRVEIIDSATNQIFDNQKSLVETISKDQFETKMLAETMTRSVDNVKYEIGMGSIEPPILASIEETVSLIVDNKASICRFGDGEFSIMAGASRQGFQRQDNKLAERLIEVLNSEDPGCLIAIADNYGSLEKYSYLYKNEIRYYMTDTVRRQHAGFLQKNKKYYNAYITTPYMLYADRNTENPGKRFDAIKSIWKGRHVVIIEGYLSRLGAGNDLFDEAKDIVRILGPAENAFDRYDEILDKAISVGKSIEGEVLFIIALGPTATVLAYDLYNAGFQALDLGHIDNDYEYFINHATERYAIPGKYVNNMTKEEEVEDIIDERYSKQIIAKIL